MSKYVIAKGYYGMGGNLAVVTCASRLAKKMGRDLLVDWVDGYYGLQDADIFQEVFQSPCNRLDREQLKAARVWPSYWQDFIHRTRPHSPLYPLSRVTAEMAEGPDAAVAANSDVIVVSRDDAYWHGADCNDEMSLLAQEIVPSDSLLARIERYRTELLGENAIGVHFRHGNGEATVVPPEIGWFFDRVESYSEGSQTSKILVCTDCRAVVDAFRDRYGERVVDTPKKYPPLGAGGMHLITGDAERLNSAEEAVIDIWLLSKCNYLVGSKSFFTGFSAKLNPALRGRIATWVPKYRAYPPQPGRVPVAQNEEMAEFFRRGDILVDGLHTEQIDNSGKVALYYLFWKLAEFRSLSELDLPTLNDQLKAMRLY